VYAFDEGENNSDGPIRDDRGFALGPRRSYFNDRYYTTARLLRTMQEIFNVEPLLGDAANEED